MRAVRAQCKDSPYGAYQGALPEVVLAVGGLLSAVPPAMEHLGGRTLHHWVGSKKVLLLFMLNCAGCEVGF